MRRGERSQERILSTAQSQFAARGYEATTIRSVATEAHIDPSMVMRYFGSKEGLFAAATSVELRIPDLAGVPRDELGVAVARHFMSTWEAETSAPLRVLLSSALSGSAAAARVSEIFRTQLEPIIRASGTADGREANERAGLISTQVLGFALCRYVLRLPPIVSLEPDAAIGWLAPVIQRYLVAPAPERRAAGGERSAAAEG
ncbi:TetR family transcriptional regulator [Paenarthrobacter sp. PH39-S1]|uniref:TetR/AcrR family transcriptional regulator n=1 Tax=Paenarthrobacter sp. PH39-S1 TaxID=3046204 RepID=UPI0024BAF9C1|nr:TetR family transcriptional regulator [Paenarthrobacter sp. PH39-S1]MDJ0356612.1 TetR family transcriptional regulator [Paenarthrobacter sp. PH39-S1]